MQLEGEGLVEVKPQKGSFVFTVDEMEFSNLCDFRTALELPALGFAMENDPLKLAEELKQALETGSSSGSIWSRIFGG